MNRTRTNPARPQAILAAVLIAFAGAAHAGNPQKDETTAREVKDELAQAATAVENYTAEQREEAVRKTRAALESIDARIEMLQGRLEEQGNAMSQAARMQTRDAIATLRGQRQKVAEWYGAMKHSSTDAWQHIKHGFSDAYRSLLDALVKAENEF